MLSFSRWPLLAAAAWGLLSVQLAADAPFDGTMQGLGDVRHHILRSEIVEREFHLFIRLPEDYPEQAATRFPTVYLLDGGMTFPLLSGYYRYLTLAEEVPAAILVGIGYGTDDWRQGNLRSTDYTAPSPEREHYGGAPRFQQVLRREILPLIESRYRSDPARRVIFGQSLGGQFVLYTAQTAPDLFWGHIASNPALHRNLPFFLEERKAVDEPVRARGKLFVSGAEQDEERFRLPAREWMAHWSAREPKPWLLRTMVLKDENHFSAAPAAFRHGMLWLFGPAAPADTLEADDGTRGSFEGEWIGQYQTRQALHGQLRISIARRGSGHEIEVVSSNEHYPSEEPEELVDSSIEGHTIRWTLFFGPNRVEWSGSLKGDFIVGELSATSKGHVAFRGYWTAVRSSSTVRPGD